MSEEKILTRVVGRPFFEKGVAYRLVESIIDPSWAGARGCSRCVFGPEMCEESESRCGHHRLRWCVLEGDAKPLIYLASPYSDIDPAVREERFQAVCRHASHMRDTGHLVFSPIAASHPLTLHGSPDTWASWQEFDELMLARCDMLVVLALEGWQQSPGVGAEIDLALKLGMPVRIVSPNKL